MKKIKELEFVKIQPNEQKQLLGGCFECGCCGMCSCDGYGDKPSTNHADRDHGVDGDSGGGGTTTCGCSSAFCMPGDNADYALYVGTLIAQWK